jgi:hypothetical protein
MNRSWRPEAPQTIAIMRQIQTGARLSSSAERPLPCPILTMEFATKRANHGRSLMVS